MKKTVNIYPNVPIVNVTPIIRGIVTRALKDETTIRKCLISGARVEEVLSDGKIIRLDLNNYNKDNNVKPVTTTPIKKKDKKSKQADIVNAVKNQVASIPVTTADAVVEAKQEEVTTAIDTTIPVTTADAVVEVKQEEQEITVVDAKDQDALTKALDVNIQVEDVEVDPKTDDELGL